MLSSELSSAPRALPPIKQSNKSTVDFGQKKSIIPGPSADPCYLGTEKPSLLPVYTKSYFTCSTDNCEGIVLEFWTDSSSRDILGLSCLLPMGMHRAQLQLWTSCGGICSVATLPTPHLRALTFISHFGITESRNG